MNRNELLRLPKGKYLLTDNIANYVYLLDMKHLDYENGFLVGRLYDYHSYSGSVLSPNITLFFSDVDIEVDWSYKKFKGRELTALSRLGSISSDFLFKNHLNNLRMVGKFNRDHVTENLDKFKRDWMINLNVREKLEIRKSRLKK